MPAPDPAFQFLCDAYTGDDYGLGWGTEPYGAEAQDPYFIPNLVIPSADLQDYRFYRVAEIRQVRHGLIIANRKFAMKKRWPLFWDPIAESELDDMVAYFQARMFRMLPYGDPEGAVVVVRWLEQDFKPVSLRGGWWKLKCTLEEI